MRKITILLLIFLLLAAPAMALWSGYGGSTSTNNSGAIPTNDSFALPSTPSIPTIPSALEPQEANASSDDDDDDDSSSSNTTVLATSQVSEQQPSSTQGDQEAIDAVVTTEKKSIWPVVLLVIFIILLIIFLVLYRMSRKFHKGVDKVKNKVNKYEHEVFDYLSHPEKMQDHLKASSQQDHPRHNLKGIPHYHHSLQQLHHYIENSLKKGYTYKEVRSVLLPQGWTDNDILNAYKQKDFKHIGGRSHGGHV